MRPAITALDVDALAWRPLGPPGLYSKLLSRDEQNGARTALQRLSPADQFEPPKVAHYHETYEEILGVKGLFSFDSKRWIRPYSYVFHPPGTVHGFKSAVIEESWFLSRVGRDLDVNLVHEPTGTDIYPIDDRVRPRGAVAMADPSTERGWASTCWGSASAPVKCCVLSIDPNTGEGSAFVDFPAGWQTELPAEIGDTYFEVFVLDGSLSLDEASYGLRFYGFYPPGHAPRAISSREGAKAYVNFGGPIGLVTP